MFSTWNRWILSSGYIAIMLLKYAGMWGDSLVVMMIAYGAVIILMIKRNQIRLMTNGGPRQPRTAAIRCCPSSENLSA